MRRFIIKCAIALFFTAAIQSTTSGQTNSSFDKQKLDTYLNTLFEESKFMGTVAIDSAGETVYRKSVGYSQKGQSPIKAGENTVYRIGSIAKTFTAAIIFQLIEEGKLSLSSKLADFYPGLPQADAITIKHLLRHQSGLYNFTNAEDYPEWMTEERSKRQLLALFKNDEPQFKPGSQFSYSNTNYVLLGFIIEDITGESYACQLQKRIANPLNLEDTFHGDGIDPKKGEAASFRFVDSAWNELPETDMSIPGAAGAVVSTTDDMITFIRALFKGKVVSEKSLDAMTSIQQGFGMGLMQIPFYGKTAYGHSGGIDGFQSNLAYFPKKDVALAVTANGVNYSFNDILIGVLSTYFGKNFKIPSFDVTTVSLNQNQMQHYVGNYSSNQLPMDIKVFVEDSVLKAQATGQMAFPLTATNDSTLRFEQAGIVMEFDSLQSGKYLQFILNQSGGSFLFKRE